MIQQSQNSNFIRNVNLEKIERQDKKKGSNKYIKILLHKLNKMINWSKKKKKYHWGLQKQWLKWLNLFGMKKFARKLHQNYYFKNEKLKS